MAPSAMFAAESDSLPDAGAAGGCLLQLVGDQGASQGSSRTGLWIHELEGPVRGSGQRQAAEGKTVVVSLVDSWNRVR